MKIRIAIIHIFANVEKASKEIQEHDLGWMFGRGVKKTFQTQVLSSSLCFPSFPVTCQQAPWEAANDAPKVLGPCHPFGRPALSFNSWFCLTPCLASYRNLLIQQTELLSILSISERKIKIKSFLRERKRNSISFKTTKFVFPSQVILSIAFFLLSWSYRK